MRSKSDVRTRLTVAPMATLAIFLGVWPARAQISARGI
jgi:hypothetical protein